MKKILQNIHKLYSLILKMICHAFLKIKELRRRIQLDKLQDQLETVIKW